MEIKTWDNKKIDIKLPEHARSDNLLILPALIDPHLHFRTPGAEYKEDWITGSQAAFAGGVSTVFDMPNNNPSCTDFTSLQNKKELIKKQLKASQIPLNFYLYLGATPANLNKFDKCKNEIIGIKMFMGSSTGNLLVDKIEDQERIFKKCSELNLVLAVHAEDEQTIKENDNKIKKENIYNHSQIRSPQAAVKAVAQAIKLAKKYQTKLYLCHISTREEIDLIKKAKSEGLKIYAEVSPHHLFLNTDSYQTLDTEVQVNPPLRTTKDNTALWKAINDGTIDTIGTDHAPHTLEEKNKPYGEASSGMPGIENYLGLLLNAYNNKKITLEKITKLTYFNIIKIFNLSANDDLVIVDLNQERIIKNEEQKTKCGWSPYDGMKLIGWPVGIYKNEKFYLN